MATNNRRFRNILDTFIVSILEIMQACFKKSVLSFMINLKTYTAYHMKTLCNTSMWPAILEDNHVWNMYANFGKDKMSTIMPCLHTAFHRNFIQYATCRTLDC